MMDPTQRYHHRQKSNGTPFFVALALAVIVATVTFIVIDFRKTDYQGPTQLGTENNGGRPPSLSSSDTNQLR